MTVLWTGLWVAERQQDQRLSIAEDKDHEEERERLSKKNIKIS